MLFFSKKWIGFYRLSATVDSPTQPQPAFTHSIELKTMAPSDAPILKLVLPDEVYVNTKDAELSDLRVFNTEGEVLSSTLRSIEPKKNKTTQAQATPASANYFWIIFSVIVGVIAIIALYFLKKKSKMNIDIE